MKQGAWIRFLRTPAVVLMMVPMFPAGALPADLAAPPDRAELPLTKIVLYSNGVAYCERNGRVTGDVQIRLPFKKAEMADVLKSLVVIDRGGTVGTVSYDLATSLEAQLADVPFHIDAGTESETAPGGLYGVLEQLQGAEVGLQAGGQKFEGAILTVTRQPGQQAEKDRPAASERLALIGDDGTLRSFDLDHIQALWLLADSDRRDIRQFTDSVARSRREEIQTLAIATSGEGSREITVGYIVAAPIWKSNYRVVLDPDGKPFFQGWALIDNTGEEDWKDVSVTLVSGSPISFIHPIQHPLYMHRPVLPLPAGLSLSPQVVDDVSVRILGGIPGGVAGGVARGAGGGIGVGSGGGAGWGVAPSEIPQDLPVPSISEALIRGEAGIRSAATGMEVGDMFEYRIGQPVSLPRRHSALIPILQQPMEGGRVSIFNADTQKDRPLGGLRLKNTSPLTLEGGTLTVLEGDSFAGEAVLERLKPGEERLVGFSRDLATLVRREVEDLQEPVCLVRAEKGFLELHYYMTQSTEYSIQNQTARPRTLYVEHPSREDWTLGPDGDQPTEKAGRYYRYRLELGPHEARTLNVVLQFPRKDTYRLAALTPENLEMFAARKYLDEPDQRLVRQILDIQSQIESLKGQAERASRECDGIVSDQQRLRENIRTMQENREGRRLLARYVDKASEQEDRLEMLRRQQQEAADARDRLEKEMESLVDAISFEHKI